MCLIAFALGAVPGHPLLIASNRDEHLARPTLPLHCRHQCPGPCSSDCRSALWLARADGEGVSFVRL